MSMKRIASVAAILSLCVVGGTAGAGENNSLSEVFRQLVMQNLEAYNREDVAGAMNYVHTKSPEYHRTQAALPNQFKMLDARTELAGFQYIGHDDEFAVARIKLKTVEKSGQSFSGNILDTMAVFHQEDGIWKYWSSHVLGVELVQ